MTRLGDMLIHTQSGFCLVIWGQSWAFEKLDTHTIVAQAMGMPDHATATQCALMCARVYVSDFYPMTAAACDKMLEAAIVSEPKFRVWLDVHHQEVVNAFLDTLPEGKKGDFPLEDLVAFGRRQFTQHLEGGT